MTSLQKVVLEIPRLFAICAYDRPAMCICRTLSLRFLAGRLFTPSYGSRLAGSLNESAGEPGCPERCQLVGHEAFVVSGLGVYPGPTPSVSLYSLKRGTRLVGEPPQLRTFKARGEVRQILDSEDVYLGYNVDVEMPSLLDNEKQCLLLLPAQVD